MVWNPEHEDRSTLDEETSEWTPRCTCGWHRAAVENRRAAKKAFRAHWSDQAELSRTAMRLH